MFMYFHKSRKVAEKLISGCLLGVKVKMCCRKFCPTTYWGTSGCGGGELIFFNHSKWLRCTIYLVSWLSHIFHKVTWLKLQCGLLPDDLLPVPRHERLGPLPVRLHRGEVHRHLPPHEGAGDLSSSLIVQHLHTSAIWDLISDFILLTSGQD